MKIKDKTYILRLETKVLGNQIWKDRLRDKIVKVPRSIWEHRSRDLN